MDLVPRDVLPDVPHGHPPVTSPRMSPGRPFRDVVGTVHMVNGALVVQPHPGPGPEPA